MIKPRKFICIFICINFVKIGQFNLEFEKITKCLQDIHLKDHQVPVDHLIIRNLLPKSLEEFWTYPGSLTTPPCSESVQWLIFKEPLEISEEQVSHF